MSEWKRKRPRRPTQTAEQWRKGRSKAKKGKSWPVWVGIDSRRSARKAGCAAGRRAGTPK